MEDPAESVVPRLRCGSSALELWTKKLNRNNTATRTHHIFIFVEEKTHHINQVARSGAGLLPSYKYCLLCRHLLLHKSLISTK